MIGCTQRSDAERVYRVSCQRCEKYGLKLHPEHTRLRPLARPETVGPDGEGAAEPDPFDFLGFTHYWGKSWKGHWVIKRKTLAQRLGRTLKAIAHWCRINRHRGMFDQFRELVRKLEGHYAYYGITGNGSSLNQARTEAVKLWYKWLRRRSRAPDGLTWERMNRLLKETFVFPYARVVHSIYNAKP